MSTFAQQPKNVQKDPSSPAPGTLTEGFNSDKPHRILSGGSVVFEPGSSLVVNGEFSGTPTSGILDLSNVVVIGGGGGLQASNIANLKARPVTGLATGQLITVLGFHTMMDGGEGIFMFTASGSYTGPDGIMVAPNVGAGYWTRLFTNGVVNVRHFGATGDGITDDTVKLQAALDWLNGHPVNSLPASNGTIYFPRGRYKATTLTVTHAYGLNIRGDAMYATALEFDTLSGSGLKLNSYIGVKIQDLSFRNMNGGGNSSALQTTSIGLETFSDGTGTALTVEKCEFTNWVHCVKNTGTSSGDSGTFRQCIFRRSVNAWYSDNLMSSIQMFQGCIYDLISLGALNTNGVGMVHFDTVNFVGAGSLIFLRPQFATFGPASHYIVTNGKMEYVPGSMWVNLAPVTSNAYFGEATFNFNNCSLSGGDAGNVTPTDVIMWLCGAMNVLWHGGFYEGALRYTKNTQLSNADNYSNGVKSEIQFIGAKRAPHPSTSLILDMLSPTTDGSGPVIAYRGCGNLPDIEVGGDMGHNFRQPHSMRWQPYVRHVGVSWMSTPYQSAVNFAGRTVRIERILFAVTGTMPVGIKRIEVFSDPFYATSLGYIDVDGTTAAFIDVPLDIMPTFIVDKLYLKFTTPVSHDVQGYWLIDYTVLS